MKVAVFNTHKFEKEYLIKANAIKHDLKLLDSYLTLDTTVLAKEILRSEGCPGTGLFPQCHSRIYGSHNLGLEP